MIQPAILDTARPCPEPGGGPLIYILLPVHNRRPITTAFATALARQTIADFHLLLLDDGSTDGTADAVRGLLGERVTVLRGDGNWWWAGALHQGWRWLKVRGLDDASVILICNDDVDLPDEFLANGLDVLAEHPRSLVIAKTKHPTTGQLEESCLTIDYLRNKVAVAQQGQPAVCGSTRGLFIRWRDMQEVGGFHPRLLPHYLSDLEWTLRAHRRGLTVRCDDRVWVVPHEKTTGLHHIASLPAHLRLKRMFSIRYSQNPLHWSAFILLGFPARYWLPALARVGLWVIGGLLGRDTLFARRRSFGPPQ